MFYLIRSMNAFVEKQIDRIVCLDEMRGNIEHDLTDFV